jgi:hypothetical protein
MPAQTSTPSAPVSPHPLRHGAFRRLWMGNLISWTGDQFYLVALPWLVLSLTASSVALGTVAMLAAVPRSVLMLLGGVISDRFSSRRILMLTAISRMLVVVAASWLLFAGKLHIAGLCWLAFLFGISDAFSYPASSALLPAIVEPGQLPAANSVSQATLQITSLAAPGPVGMFIQAFGTAWALLLDGISFLAIPIALAGLPDPPAPAVRAPRQNVLRAMTEGLRYVWADAAMRSLIMVVGVLNMALAGPMSVGLAVIAKQRFGTPAAFGWLTSSFGAGALAGMLVAGLIPQRRLGRTLLAANAAIGLCVMPIGAIGSIRLLILDLILLSAVAALLNVQLIGWLQQRVERALMGRVMSVVMFAAVGLMPLSMALTGVALKAGAAATFCAAGALVLIVDLVATSQREVRAID